MKWCDIKEYQPHMGYNRVLNCGCPQTQGGGVQSVLTYTDEKDTATIMRFFNNVWGTGTHPFRSTPQADWSNLAQEICTKEA